MFALCFASVKAFKPFPAKYTIRGTWSVPYCNLTNPIIIVHEPTRQYTDKYHGLERIWTTLGEEKLHRKIVVADDKAICYGYTPENGDWDLELNEFLPSPDGYTLVGMRQHRGRLCEMWRKTEDTPKKQTWEIYIDQETGFPVAYVMHAISLYHSHYDIYKLEIDDFQPTALPGVWTLPDICNNPEIQSDPYPGVNEIKTIIDNAAKAAEERGRSEKASKPQWINKLGGRRTKTAADGEICKLYHAQNIELPKEFTWRNVSNIVGKPRDQCACGSCWAFGTAEALESQLALKTGVFRELSVNQVMDCTWDYNNTGCQGGEAGPAFRSLVEQHALLALESEYPYIGVTGYCNRNIAKPVARVVDCWAVDRTTQALKEAVYRFGPASIGINVIESMSFFTGGVVNDESCTGSADDLVHEVLLTGWVVRDNVTAWEIKNSWSTHWGEEGYIYIQADHQEWNCGVTTDAKIPVIEVLE